MEKINYTLTLDDCSDFAKYQMKIKRVRKFILKSYFPKWIICMWGLLIVLEFFIGNFISFLLVLVAVYAGMLTMQYRDMFHCVSREIYKKFQGGCLDVEIELKDDGLCITGKGITSYINWPAIIDIYDTGKTFLIYVSDYQAFLVPQRAFANQKDKQEFFSYINEKQNKKS